MRSTRLRGIFIAVSIGLALLIACVSWPYVAWLMFGVKTELKNYDDFVVSGTVVDEKGAPFDALVSVQKSWTRKMGFERDVKSTVEPVRGKFHFTVNNCDSVHIRFTKIGYQMETLSFPTDGKYENLRVVMKPGPTIPSATTKRAE